MGPIEQPRDFLRDGERETLDRYIQEDRQVYQFWWDDWLPGVDAILVVNRSTDTLAGPLTIEFGERVVGAVNVAMDELHRPGESPVPNGPGRGTRPREYHEGALARLGKEPYDGSVKYPNMRAEFSRPLTDEQALSWPVRFVPRDELKAMCPEPKRKRPRFGKRRVR